MNEVFLLNYKKNLIHRKVFHFTHFWDPFRNSHPSSNKRQQKKKQKKFHNIHFQLISYSNTNHGKLNSICSTHFLYRLEHFCFHFSFSRSENIFLYLCRNLLEQQAVRVPPLTPLSYVSLFFICTKAGKRFTEGDQSLWWHNDSFTCDASQTPIKMIRNPNGMNTGTKFNHTRNCSAQNQEEKKSKENSCSGKIDARMKIFCFQTTFPSHSVVRFSV